jgi:Peptidase S24-like
MGWATLAIERLQRGETVVVRPRGHSMAGRVDDGDRVTVEPFGTHEPAVGDVVLVRCRGHEYLHLIKARRGDQFLIGNNRGGINGWVGRRQLFGIATQIASGKR